MYLIKKEFNIAIGHRLFHHTGKCHNIHGHGLKIIVRVNGDALNPKGMIIDFYDLKTIAEPIIDVWDHALILNSNDSKLINFALENKFKLSIVHCEPTCENLCRHLYDALKYKIPQLHSITIFESETSSCTYNPNM
jgi:6-pyruvoyltetrahydropterin/6-carboxytetrahydropterin synthase